MAAIRPTCEALQECMKHPDSVRNVCILAHVDHGKTTIADSLLATNRIISKRQAGFMRHLDDRPDEEERGITMKSSAVSLLNKVNDDNSDEEKLLLLNLIDTPGHIDFSSEVSAALRVSDGALIVVDLVEGVCVQTREAIKLAFTEHCKMVLLLNKFDKLIVELHKDTAEIFQDILRAIENCNALIAELYQYECSEGEVDIEDTGLLFSPDLGNVLFASAIDGWGFTLKHIAEMFVGTVKNETVETLTVKLWNFDAFADSKSGTVKFGAIEKGKSNLFTQLCLRTICHIYTTIVIQMEREKVVAIAEKLKITNIVVRDMNNNDPKVRLRAVMQAWSPLAKVILGRCLKQIPAPNKIKMSKIKYLLDYERFCEEEPNRKLLEDLRSGLEACSENGDTIAYVSKMFCVDKKNLSQSKPKPFMPKPRPSGDQSIEQPKQLENGVEDKVEFKEVNKVAEEGIEEEQDFSIIALARVFSGSLKVGQEIYVLSPKYVPGDNEDSQKNVQIVTIKELYILIGRDLQLVDSITAGNVCGIGGLESAIVRTATIPSTLKCVPLLEHPFSPPIVRNAIEPVNPADLPILRKGLRVLMQSDSCVQVMVQETGEYVLMTCGDVHLAKCLLDLTTMFAKIEVNVSSPMVSLRETITHASKSDFKKDLDNVVEIDIAQISVKLAAVSLPEDIAIEIEKNYKLLHSTEDHQLLSGYEISIKREKCADNLNPPIPKKFKSDAINASLQHAKEVLSKTFDSTELHKFWSKFTHKIWSIGKMADSINLLINATPDYSRSIFETLDETDPRSCFDHFVVNAFNAYCKSGPLCEEPLKNCAFIVKSYALIHPETLDGSTKSNVNIESALNAGFREAFEKQPQRRLMEPMFTTTIQVNVNILGKVYSVVSKRHGKVLDAVGMDEQEKSFLVQAQIPVVDSTGFANEMRKTTSGQAIPNLKFSHFEIIDGDPFYEPLEEEDDEEDVNVESAVRASRLRKEIRKRKGLHVEEQVVVHAEKQRTLNKKK